MIAAYSSATGHLRRDMGEMPGFCAATDQLRQDKAWYNVPWLFKTSHSQAMEDTVMKSQRIVLLALVSVLIIALLAACSGGTVGGTKAPSSGGGQNL